MADTYEGWKNYETWAANLWLANDEHAYRETMAMAREAWAESEDLEEPWTDLPDGRERQARYYLSERLRNELDETRPDLGASMWSDLLGAAFGRVDFHELAGYWLTAAREEMGTFIGHGRA